MNKERQQEEKRIRHLLFAIDPLDEPSHTRGGHRKYQRVARQAQQLNSDPVTRSFLHAFLNNAKVALNTNMQNPEVRRMLLGDWKLLLKEKRK